MISRIVHRNDNLNDDASEFNKILRETCSKRNIGFIDNENINPTYNCNRSKLHLNKRATNLLTENILFSLYNEISDWHEGTVSKNSSCKSKPKPNKILPLLDDSIFPFLTKLRSEHPKNVLLGHLNTNSVRNKFELTNKLIRNNFDIFITTESKLDSSFPDSQFHVPGYGLFWKDRNKNGGGLMCYINQDLTVKIVTSYKFPTNL